MKKIIKETLNLLVEEREITQYPPCPDCGSEAGVRTSSRGRQEYICKNKNCLRAFRDFIGENKNIIAITVKEYLQNQQKINLGPYIHHAQSVVVLMLRHMVSVVGNSIIDASRA